MPIPATDVQARWQALTDDPLLRDLPYKVETNAADQLVLSPHSNRHSLQQAAIQEVLRTHAPPGTVAPEFALATPEGVKVPDVVWMSDARRSAMEATGDPSTLAPEICVEVLSAANTAAGMAAKRALYRAAGAEEVWLVAADGTIRFYAEEALEASALVPAAPHQL
ncbi:Uma2 family endonuclease [Salisaeta longa]|uniref:Uma2 family endonuclease n=1 Tax=Salisaeta longa TaxID=503170 RepID=UPI0003B316D6|nr:Uma2 family endonuclease [Salisaeta longa]